MNKLLLGIDVGTSSVKAALFRQDCSLVGLGSGKYPIHSTQPLYREQSAEDWWQATVQATRQALQGAGLNNAYEIAGISVSSQAPSLVPIDRDGNPLRNAIIWMDRRAASECDYLANELIGLERYQRVLGATPDAFYILPKLYWFKQNEPELFQKTYKILQTNGYINFRLTGNHSIDIIHAISVQGMDIRSRKWSKEISEAVGLDFEGLFPPISECQQVIGTVNKKAAEETGLKEGIPVVAGTTDTIAACMGFGLSRPGEAAEMTGTSTLLFFSHNKPLENSGPLLLKPSPIKGIESILVSPISTTGASVEWFLNTLGMEERESARQAGKSVYDVFNQTAEHAAPGCGGLIYFPYLSGERGPLWNSYAKGMFIGLSLNTGRPELIRSILEGTAFAIRHNFEEAQKLGLQISSVFSAGGGSRSEIWLKIKASVLGRPLAVLDDRGADCATLGDALLAGLGVGLFSDIREANEKAVVIKKIVEPDREWQRVYEELFPYYLDMYKNLAPDLKGLEQSVKYF